MELIHIVYNKIPIFRLNKQREDIASSRQLNSMPLQSNAINVKLEERIVHLENEITKRQTINDMKQQKDHSSEIERASLRSSVKWLMPRDGQKLTHRLQLLVPNSIFNPDLTLPLSIPHDPGNLFITIKIWSLWLGVCVSLLLVPYQLM